MPIVPVISALSIRSAAKCISGWATKFSIAQGPARLRGLADLVSGPNVRVVFISERGARRELGSMIVNATEPVISDPEMSMDSFRWIRTGRREVSAHRDGVTIDTSGTGRFMTIAGNQTIDAGRAWQRLHLAATAQGLAAQPLNQPAEMIDRNQMLGRNDEFGPSLAALVRTEGWEPTFVFRLGYPKGQGLRSPRRPLVDVVKGGQFQ
jgi:nitroreductase